MCRFVSKSSAWCCLRVGHVTPVGGSWLPIQTEVTVIGTSGAEQWGEGFSRRSHNCHNVPQPCALSESDNLLPVPALVADACLQEVRMRTLGSQDPAHIQEQ